MRVLQARARRHHELFHDEIDLPPARLKVKTSGRPCGPQRPPLDPRPHRRGLPARPHGRGAPRAQGSRGGIRAPRLRESRGGIPPDTPRGISDAAAALAEGDAPRFQNAVALRLNPPRSSGGKTETLAPTRAGARAHRPPPNRRPRGPPARLSSASSTVSDEKPPAASREQARACAGLGSPFMERPHVALRTRLAPGSAVADRVLGWPGNFGPSGDVVPLRLAGALHGLVRVDGSGNLPAPTHPAVSERRRTLGSSRKGACSRNGARQPPVARQRAPGCLA